MYLRGVSTLCTKVLSLFGIMRETFYRCLLWHGRLSWTGSEPPRGSGWVHAQHFSIGAYGVPTRYRDVVLTLSKKVALTEVQEPEETYYKTCKKRVRENV